MKFILAFALAATAFLFLMYSVILPEYDTGYNASVIDKMNRLKSLSSPKIILIGDSSLAFGMNSEKLSDALQMPVVNLGIHAGLGNSFEERMVIGNVKQGDIVVAAFTGYGDNGTIPDHALAWITIENHLDYYSFIGEDDIPEMLKTLPNYLLKSLYLWITNSGTVKSKCYSRKSFNEYGDVACDKHENKYQFSEQSALHVPVINQTCINNLNNLSDYISSCGGTLVIAAYPIAYGEYSPSRDDYNEFQKKLENQLNCPVISRFEDYLFDYSLFYDTAYHLTNAGTEKRTDLLISDLKKFLAKESK